MLMVTILCLDDIVYINDLGIKLRRGDEADLIYVSAMGSRDLAIAEENGFVKMAIKNPQVLNDPRATQNNPNVVLIEAMNELISEIRLLRKQMEASPSIRYVYTNNPSQQESVVVPASPPPVSQPPGTEPMPDDNYIPSNLGSDHKIDIKSVSVGNVSTVGDSATALREARKKNG